MASNNLDQKIQSIEVSLETFKTQKITSNTIFDAVESVCGYSKALILSKITTYLLVDARHICVGLHFAAIGINTKLVFDNFTDQSVIKMYRAHENKLLTDDSYVNNFNSCKQILFTKGINI